LPYRELQTWSRLRPDIPRRALDWLPVRSPAGAFFTMSPTAWGAELAAIRHPRSLRLSSPTCSEPTSRSAANTCAPSIVRAKSAAWEETVLMKVSQTTARGSCPISDCVRADTRLWAFVESPRDFL